VSEAARLRPVGECALTVELGEGIDPVTSARVRALDAALGRDPPPGVIETVPSFRSLLVVFDPLRVSAAAVGEAALSRLSAAAPPPRVPAIHEIPVSYGGEDGPDLLEVARRTGLDPSRVVERHAGAEYTALMLGFMPGFAYLGMLPQDLHVPRRATPRTRVPAGSVAIAAGQTAIYPSATPGGWHLIGRTSLRLFDPAADPPALLRPGDRVRFVSVDRGTLPAPAPARAPFLSTGPAAVEVLEAGLLTTVQDGGRPGWRRFGVGAAGAMDERALVEANGAVGNPAGAAVLECTVAGPTLRFLAAAHLAVTGADLGAVLHRADLGDWRVPLGVRVRARAGNVLAFSGPRRGCRAYVAIAGGFDVPEVLGARSTDLAGTFGGFGGRPLRAGDALRAGPAAAAAFVQASARARSETGGVTTVRVVAGPQDDLFTAAALRVFFSSEYGVRPGSDRVGCRLEGAALAHVGPSEIPSDGMLPGCIQVPPDGQPIVMGADSPTTGGYPKIATVIRADRPLVAQLVPGRSRVRFERVTVEAALLAMMAG
jgi:KipI family sensor histidine kinase inhibitor